MRSSVLARKSGSGPLAQSGTDGNGEEIGLLARVAAGVARHGKLPPQRHEELPPPRIAEERVNEGGTNH